MNILELEKLQVILSVPTGVVFYFYIQLLSRKHCKIVETMHIRNSSFLKRNNEKVVRHRSLEFRTRHKFGSFCHRSGILKLCNS